MADDGNKFTHVAVLPATQRKIALLARTFDEKIYELVARWADQDWEQAVASGLVTEGMLQGRRQDAQD